MSDPTSPDRADARVGAGEGADSVRARELFALRSYYFCIFAGLGGFFPYLPVLLSRRGYSGDQIAWVMVLLPATGLLVPPLWGLIADMLRARVAALRLAGLGCGVTLLLMLHDGGLWWVLLAIGLFSFFRAPLTSLADAASHAVLGREQVRFSRVRLWGSVGFALLVFGVGQLGGTAQPRLLVGVTSALYAMSAVAALLMRAAPIRRQPGVLRQTWQVLSRPVMLLFLLATTFYYCGHATFDAYFSLHVGRLGHDEGFVGLAWGVGVVAEILLMIVAPRFICRLRSSVFLCICAAAATARWALLSRLTGRLGILALQPLHGVTFGLWYLSMVRFVQTRAPEHLRTSLQATAQGGMGLGMVTGYLAGGMILERLGGAWLYRLAALSAGVALILYLGTTRIRRSG